MNPAQPRPTKCLAALLAATAVPAACGGIVSLSPAQINGQAKAASFANDDVTLVPLIGTTPATFNSLAARLGIPGTNANAFNDPDTNPDNGNEQKLRFVFAPHAGLTGLSWDWSRADGPGSRSGVTITGFTADPGATFS